ncbi:MAG: ABC transporter permease [Gammaproteobacteria bacterium]|nr:ABC transporter permease [Gammaproteobacteria bacterium]
MPHVLLALILHEFKERLRDRWVIIITILFTLLAIGIVNYAQQGSSDNSLVLAGASMITLATLFVPLVALILGHDAIVGERERNSLRLILSLPVNRVEVLLCKYIARFMALTISILIGFGLAIYTAEFEDNQALLTLLEPTICLGAAFLSLGVAISVFAKRQTTAISIVITLWFLLVFFFDLGLLGLLVITDGSLSTQVTSSLILMNPAGLYRIQLMNEFANAEFLQSLGLVMSPPSVAQIFMLWGVWIVGPFAMSAIILNYRKSLR